MTSEPRLSIVNKDSLLTLSEPLFAMPLSESPILPAEGGEKKREEGMGRGGKESSAA